MRVARTRIRKLPAGSKSTPITIPSGSPNSAIHRSTDRGLTNNCSNDCLMNYLYPREPPSVVGSATRITDEKSPLHSLTLEPGFECKRALRRLRFTSRAGANAPKVPGGIGLATFPVAPSNRAAMTEETLFGTGLVARRHRPKIEKIHPLIVVGGQRCFQKPDSLAHGFI